MNVENKNTRSFQNKPMSEINVTPFVDVMLVLLIIFMITAPLLTSGVSVDLPSTDSEALPVQDEPLTITINKNKEISFDFKISPLYREYINFSLKGQEIKRFNELTAGKSKGFRAPSFSLIKTSSWAIDLLEKNNYV